LLCVRQEKIHFSEGKGKRAKEKNLKNREMTMGLVESVLDNLFLLLVWTWRYGGWWSVAGGILCVLFFGLRLPLAHHHKG
jgi:hypothetical protein